MQQEQGKEQEGQKVEQLQKQPEGQINVEQNDKQEGEFQLKQRLKGKQKMTTQGQLQCKGALSDTEMEKILMTNRYSSLRKQEEYSTAKVTEGIGLNEENPP